MDKIGVGDDSYEGIGSPIALNAEVGKEAKPEHHNKDRKKKVG